ncbi:F-box/kelch-repeat protein-like protein [Tanacetum coccineum]
MGLIPRTFLLLHEPETVAGAKWPPIPELGSWISRIMCEMVAYGWRRGANMPGGHRWFFGCAADGDGTIYVAGGYDVNENPLNSAWTYHVYAGTIHQTSKFLHTSKKMATDGKSVDVD